MRPIAASLKNDNRQPFKTVGDLALSRRCMTFHPDEFVNVILPVLQTSAAGAAGVVDDEGSLVGLLTERHILRHVFLKVFDPTINPANLRKYLEDMTVEEAMIPAPETLDESIGMEDAVGMMVRRGYRFMPVVSRTDKRHLLGIVDEREIALHLKNQLQEVKKTAEETQSILSFMLREPYGAGMQLTGT